MLEIVEAHDEKVACQERFNALVQREWQQVENRRVVWRPESRLLDIAHNGKLWFVSVKPGGDQKILRYWNSFGIYRADGNLPITVEVNIPTESNGHDVSGFFARDPSSDIVYLMHDGGVGGGRKGVGRENFLAWAGFKLVPTMDAEGRGRLGILVAPLVDGKVSIPASSFVNKVAAFKDAVAHGQVPNGAKAKSIKASYADYFREFSGRKKAQRAREVEYISRHGDIGDELTRWRPAKRGERLVKDGYIDLGVEAAGKLKVLYEVKTSTSRYNLYTAIGQILVHGRNAVALESYVVVPAGDSMPADVGEALRTLEIGVLRYRLAGKKVVIEAPV